VIGGLENARNALNQLFEGSNVGKLLIRVGEPTGQAADASAGVGATA